MLQSQEFAVENAREITALLVELREGKPEVRERLIPLVYGELRKLAAIHLRRQHAAHTLESGALVNEVYLRLVGGSRRPPEWQNRAHFFAVASSAMRHILVDHARSRGSLKRGGDLRRVSVDQEVVVSGERLEEILAVDELLIQLSGWNERQGKVFEMYFFGGLSQEEIAEALDVSVRTVKRDWSLARAWLRSRLSS